jgi:hypothetical protein
MKCGLADGTVPFACGVAPYALESPFHFRLLGFHSFLFRFCLSYSLFPLSHSLPFSLLLSTAGRKLCTGVPHVHGHRQPHGGGDCVWHGLVRHQRAGRLRLARFCTSPLCLSVSLWLVCLSCLTVSVRNQTTATALPAAAAGELLPIDPTAAASLSRLRADLTAATADRDELRAVRPLLTHVSGGWGF